MRNVCCFSGKSGRYLVCLNDIIVFKSSVFKVLWLQKFQSVQKCHQVTKQRYSVYLLKISFSKQIGFECEYYRGYILSIDTVLVVQILRVILLQNWKMNISGYFYIEKHTIVRFRCLFFLEGWWWRASILLYNFMVLSFLV